MAIADTDLKFNLAILTGSAGNSSAQADPNASLGKYISTTVIDQGVTLHNLFDKVTGTENAASDVEYRLAFVKNDHATLTAEDCRVWINSQISGGASIAIGLDTTAASAKGSSSAQALTIADESTAPVGVSFSAPTDYAGGLQIGNLAAGFVKGIWIRRTAANTGPKDTDGATIGFQVDTGE